MATLTLKNVPDALHQRLKAQAARNHRSLNREAIRLLEKAFEKQPASDDPIARADALHDRLAASDVWIDHGSVQQIIDEGRP